MWLHRGQSVTNPSNHTKVHGGVDVTHKAMKRAVTFRRTFAHKADQMTDSAEKIETRQTSSIKGFIRTFAAIG
eukprot:3486223-Heterocapsa_arctica.AAC.1